MPMSKIALNQYALFGTGAAETDDESSGQPNVVLVSAEKRGAIVIGVKNADGEVRPKIEIHATAGFKRKSKIGEGKPARTCGCIVHVRAPDQKFGERTGAPLVAFAMEHASAVMVSVQRDIHAVVGRNVIAGVGYDLQPGFS